MYFLLVLFECIILGKLVSAFFHTANKLPGENSLFVNVDYGNGQVPVIATKTRTDSVFIPLRVDDVPFTKIYVGLSRAAITSEIKINYETKSEYNIFHKMLINVQYFAVGLY